MKPVKSAIDKLFLGRIRGHKREIGLCAHAFFGVMIGLAVSSAATAAPQNGVVTNGSLGAGGITYGSTTTIDQKGVGGSKRVTIRWDSFDTASGELVHFRQRSNQTAINRILGNANGIGGNTIFNGGLTGAGNIILINQNGFLFGKDSQIRVGSFMATTNGKGVPKDLSTFEDWINNHKKAPNYAEIINQGGITITKDGGFGLLVAPYVSNEGTIKAKKGVSNVTIGLGAIDVKNSATGTGRKGIENTGTLRARSGYVAMVNSIFNAAVNVGGILDVDIFARNDDGGTILVASKGDIELRGAKFTARGGRDVEVYLHADNDILSNSDVTTFKLKAGEVDRGGAYAYLVMEADGVIDILTDVSVVAEAAFAEAEFVAAGQRGVAITTGDETIRVKAIGEGTKWSKGNAMAYAGLYIDSLGDVEVNGHVVVKAKADAHGAGDADADADIEIWADQVDINGDIDVIARANAEGHRHNRSEAIATSTIMADGKGGAISYLGDMNIDAKSNGGSSSYAYAGGLLLASGDISYTGDLDINAKATEGEYSESMAGGLLLSAGDVNYNGSLNVNAGSRGEDALSLAGGLLLSSGDLVYNGDSNVSAKSRSSNGGNTTAAAGLAMLAGLNIGGHHPDGWISPSTLTMNGDVLVEADAKGPNSNALALGLGIFAAGGDVNVDADSVVVNSLATSKGRRSKVTSIAGLVTFAGLDTIEAAFTGGSVLPYNLNIAGDLEANAIAEASLDPDETALAANALLASGDITLRGADPLASANEALVQDEITMFEGCGDYGIGCLSGPGIDLQLLFATLDPSDPGNGYAQLIIEAGGTVDIQPRQGAITGPNELFAFRPTNRPSGTTGNQPLRIAGNGDMLAATGFGLTQPPQIRVADVDNIDIEAAVLAGADPAALLPPTAAGGDVTTINNNDTMTSSAPDFCDRLVSGACYESE